ncbi:MAG: formylglycine-generating enzyme family protein [Pirellulaceae bacterium]|jgi:formylglycine-generating enzyme required for sulfatase activity|nr:formylglycine-generating enzyme family protein [Pirellulaceae bacterium]
MTNTTPTATAVFFLTVASALTGAAEPPPLAKAPFNAEQAKQFQQQWAEHIGKPLVYTNSIGMKMVLLPSGEFRQGASREELDSITRDIQQNKGGNPRSIQWSLDHIHPYEGPDRRVRLTRPYRIAAHEVTVGQFRKFVEATGYKTDAEREEIDPKSKEPRRTWRKSIFPQTDDHPVLEVSWHDAMALCHWLSKKEGRIYRLPTEAEWDFAARAGSTDRWCFGNDRSKLADYAWYNGWGSGNSGGKPQPVGKKSPNAFGLYDMHGNMWEYVSDFFADIDFKLRYSRQQPEVTIDPTGIKWGGRTALRGGSFDFPWFFQRSAARLGGARRYQHIWHMGFRIVMVIGDDSPTVPVDTSLGRGPRPASRHAAASELRETQNEPRPGVRNQRR